MCYQAAILRLFQCFCLTSLLLNVQITMSEVFSAHGDERTCIPSSHSLDCDNVGFKTQYSPITSWKYANVQSLTLPPLLLFVLDWRLI